MVRHLFYQFDYPVFIQCLHSYMYKHWMRQTRAQSVHTISGRFGIAAVPTRPRGQSESISAHKERE